MIQTVKVSGEVVGEGGAEKEKGYDKWELEDAARTLVRAEEIKGDKKLMDALGPYLDKQVGAYKSIAQLRAKSRKLAETK
jgi:hypothetical protein